MALTTAPRDAIESPDHVAWGGVAAMCLAVAAVMTAELLPVGLLTLIAHDLGITGGAAGQAVTVTAIAGIVTGLCIAPVTRRINRRTVILSIGALLIASNLVAAFAAGFGTLLVARVGVGIAHGGLWALVPATAIRLAPQSAVPRVLSIIFAGISAAITLTTPLGSFLGEAVGWRGAFAMAAAVAGVATLLLYLRLPTMAVAPGASAKLPLGLLREPYLLIGMLAVVAVFAGHYAFFTYVRPFIEHLPGMGKGSLPFVLFLYGIANFVGVTLAGRLLAANLFATLAVPPLAMGLMAFALVGLTTSPILACSMVVAWGFVYGMVPVGWNTWVARTNTVRVEGAGGLLVACIQSGIAAGAALGGIAFDTRGYAGAFSAGGAILLVTCGLAILAGRAWTKDIQAR